MPNYENRYKAVATTILEREIRRLEGKNKTAHTYPGDEYNAAVDTLFANINFSLVIGLLAADQAKTYRQRIIRAGQIRADIQRLDREESRMIVDDYENPRERVQRFQKMDEYKAKIISQKSINTGNVPPSRENLSSTPHEGDERFLK